MSAAIHRDPVLDFRLFGQRISLDSLFPFDRKGVISFGYARVALYEGLKILGIKEGDTVLVPNYVCNVVAAPMHHLNIKVRFYEVDDNLRPQWGKIAIQMDDGVKALIIVNYFGFPNDILAARNFCDLRGIYLIEDNAHGFLSTQNNQPLGSGGHMSFFSFRKMVPVPNGAALLVNDKALHQRLSKPNYLIGKNADTRFIVKSFMNNLSEKVDFEECRIRDRVEEYNLDRYFKPFSRLGNFLLRRFDFEYIKEQRIKGYCEWLDFFSHNREDKVRIVFSFLEEGVVPSCFPVLANKRDQFIAKMWKRGIECFPWPFLPEKSGESQLVNEMVCLPVFPFNRLSSTLRSAHKEGKL